MPRNYKDIREVVIEKDFPKGTANKPLKVRFAAGSTHYMHKSLATKLEKAGVTKSVKPYDRDAAIEAEKKAVLKAKKAEKEANSVN